MYRIFLSSTRIDQLAHRTQVHEVLERLEQFAVDMAQFGAQGSGDAVTVSLEKVRSAQVYLGIIAWRYGYVPVLAPFIICLKNEQSSSLSNSSFSELMTKSSQHRTARCPD